MEGKNLNQFLLMGLVSASLVYAEPKGISKSKIDEINGYIEKADVKSNKLLSCVQEDPLFKIHKEEISFLYKDVVSFMKKNARGPYKKYVGNAHSNLIYSKIFFYGQLYKDQAGYNLFSQNCTLDNAEEAAEKGVRGIGLLTHQYKELMPLYKKITSECYILGLKSVHAQKDKLQKQYEHPKNPYSAAEYTQKQSDLDIRLTKFMDGFYQHELVTPKYEEQFTQLVHKYGYEHKIPAVYNQSEQEKPQYVAFYVPKQQRTAYSAPQITQYTTKQLSPLAYARAENITKQNLGANARHSHIIPSLENKGDMVMIPLHAQSSPGYDSAMRHAFNYGAMMPKGTKALAYLKESNKMAQEASDMIEASKKYLTHAKTPEYNPPRITVRPAKATNDGQITSYQQPLAYNTQIKLPQKAAYALNPQARAYHVPSRGVYLPATTSYTPTGDTIAYTPNSR